MAVVGATGAVGREMLAVLEQREFPVASLTLLASQRSVGSALPFQGTSGCNWLRGPSVRQEISVIPDMLNPDHPWQPGLKSGLWYLLHGNHRAGCLENNVLRR